jgi:hypothetical protein
VIGHLHGVSFAGKRDDATPFLQGTRCTWAPWHPLPTRCPPGPRRAAWTLAVGLSLTRIVVLAHWASDVVVGLALGALIERTLRPWTALSGEGER